MLLCLLSQNHCRSSPLFKSQQPQQPRRSQHQLPQPTLTAPILAATGWYYWGPSRRFRLKLGSWTSQTKKNLFVLGHFYHTIYHIYGQFSGNLCFLEILTKIGNVKDPPTVSKNLKWGAPQYSIILLCCQKILYNW